MTTPVDDAPCSWPVDMTCFTDEIPAERADLARSAVDTATAILWALTGRQFGVCPVIFPVGPDGCRPVCEPVLWNGKWYNTPQGDGVCRTVDLPGPVYWVDRVVDAEGEDLATSIAGDGSVRVFGGASSRGFTVEYRRGLPTPAGAARMVGRLASQRYLQCLGDKKCELPSNTTSVTRQGVTVQMADPAEVIGQGLTGLPDVDAWVRAFNPHGLAEWPEVIG